MNTEPTNLTRRDALMRALKGTVVAVVATPIIVQGKPEDSANEDATFCPENDYPFFGYEPGSTA